MSQIEEPAAGVLFGEVLNWLGDGIILGFLAIVPMANQGSDPLFRRSSGMEVARFTPG